MLSDCGKSDLRGKKILILGGAYQHRKLVQRAKELGIETYVTDYLEIEDSPAKQMADHPYMYNLTDYDDLVDLCQREHIDGIISPYLDVTQKPYQILCERLGYPCFGTAEQHKILMDKASFKAFCEKHGADVIPYYAENDFFEANESIEYPVLVKPCDSRGSRGQSVCYNREEVLQGIEFARSESHSGEVIIEKYMGSCNDVQLVYMVVNETPRLLKVEDRYLGEKENGLDKLCIATIAPSVHEQVFVEKANKIVSTMIKEIGLKNSPVFIQAFMDGDKARLYDPGIRLPGDDYDVAYKAITGIDIPEMLIRFALTGEMAEEMGEAISKTKLNKMAVMILPCLREGKITAIEGLDKIKENACVVEYSHAYAVGDYVETQKNVKQRFGEFVLVCDDPEHLKKTIEWLFDTLHVVDEHGEDMLIAKFDVNNLAKYRKETL